jgi:hypothetical protein
MHRQGIAQTRPWQYQLELHVSITALLLKKNIGMFLTVTGKHG